jgi:hypothetical protein
MNSKKVLDEDMLFGLSILLPISDDSQYRNIQSLMGNVWSLKKENEAQKNLSQYSEIIHVNLKENRIITGPSTSGRDCRICRDQSFRDGASMFTKVEEPDYTVLESLENNVEIREYQPQIWAAISKGSENGAFGTLASYIFGDNNRKERIGMTAPVVTEEGRMAFVMPNMYDLLSLPQPCDVQIKIESIASRTLAVIRFSGFTGPEKDEKNLRILDQTLQEHGIKTEGRPFVMRYNPPWTPPFMRRNEVALLVKR